MRPSCFAASGTPALTAFSSATSNTAAIALAPSTSICRTTGPSRLPVRHDEHGGNRLAAVALDFAHDLPGFNLVQSHIHDHRRATCGQRLRHRAPNVAASAGHERDAA